MFLMIKTASQNAFLSEKGIFIKEVIFMLFGFFPFLRGVVKLFVLIKVLQCHKPNSPDYQESFSPTEDTACELLEFLFFFYQGCFS